MSFTAQVYHIFNDEGKLLQIEYALEAIHNAPQIISLSSNEFVVNVSKRIVVPSLQEEKVSSIYKIADNIYCNITGLPADIDYVISKSRDLASKKEYSLGLGAIPLPNAVPGASKLTPDIFCKSLADKFQQLIQRSGQRVPAFAAMIFGMEHGNPSMYYTDLSAVDLPCFAICSGEDHHKMLTFLEKNYKKTSMTRGELIKVGVSTLIQSIGKEAEYTEVEVSVFSKDGLVFLSDQELESVLQEISENNE